MTMQSDPTRVIIDDAGSPRSPVFVVSLSLISGLALLAAMGCAHKPEPEPVWLKVEIGGFCKTRSGTLRMYANQYKQLNEAPHGEKTPTHYFPAPVIARNAATKHLQEQQAFCMSIRKLTMLERIALTGEMIKAATSLQHAKDTIDIQHALESMLTLANKTDELPIEAGGLWTVDDSNPR